MKRPIYILLAALALLTGGCGNAPQWKVAEGAVWHTTYRIVYDAPEALDDSIQAVLRQVEMSLSPFARDSRISRINRGETDSVDADIAAVFAVAQQVNRLSHGRFDPTVAPLVDLWGFGTENERVPEKAEISAALNGTDSAVEINENGIKIPSGTVLDLGSVGKGIACDEVRGVLEKAKIKRAVVSVGGSILLYGDGEKFTVGIRDPFSESSAESFARLTLPACCVSTSGSYERYFERGGVRYHHILDPKTGYPAESGLVSVTVVCDDGFLSDALSTACFVLGYEKSLPMLKKYGARAVFVFNDKSVRVTGSLADSFELEKDGFKLL